MATIYCIFLLINALCANQDISKIIDVKENERFYDILANLTEIFIDKGKVTPSQIKSGTIIPLDERELNPFKFTSNNLLQAVGQIDRESICSDKPSLNIQRLCQDDECCKLLGFQYLTDGIDKTILILIRIVDVNDQEPRFNNVKSPLAIIPENVKIGHSIPLPIAIDTDSKMYSIKRYSISDQFVKGDSNHFRLHVTKDQPVKPNLIVAVPLDYEKIQRYVFTLYAYDFEIGSTGNSGSATIEIEVEDVNDNAPKFDQSIYSIDIKEYDLNDQLFKYKVTDLDSGLNGMVSVSTDEMNEMSKRFVISNPDKSYGYIGLKSPLDFEVDPHQFQINLIARDKGTPSLSTTATVKIRLININDNGPKIEFYKGRTATNSISIMEGIQQSTIVAMIRVRDPDSELAHISCSLMNYKELFYLDQPTGPNALLDFRQFSLKTLLIIDRESELGPYLRVIIQCNDNDATRPMITNESLNIQIDDVNDNHPTFSSQTYTGDIDENKINVAVYFQKEIHAADKDYGNNGKIDYRIEDFLNSSDSQSFLCDRTSGKIVSQKMLDYETTKQYRFKIIASDKGQKSLSSSATVIVNVQDLNDNAPVFVESHYSFSVSEDANIGTKIGIVSATDQDTLPDYKNIRYYIDTKQGHTNSIEIDRLTGEIRTKKSLDREQFESINFRVIARNPSSYAPSTIPSTSEVVVVIRITDVNDNKPQFKQKSHILNSVEFVLEQYIEGNTCSELPYTVFDADHDSTNGQNCCFVTLENDFDNLLSLMTDNPSYICLTRKPTKHQTLDVTLIAKDRPLPNQKQLESKITFQVHIKTNNPPYPSPITIDPQPPSNTDSRNIVIIAILTTVVVIFVVIIVIIIIIFKRCSIADREYENTKCLQVNDPSAHGLDSTKFAFPSTENCMSQGKPTVQHNFVVSPHYTNSLHKTMSRSSHQMMLPYAATLTPAIHRPIITSQGMRIIPNQNQINDTYVYEWPQTGAVEQAQTFSMTRNIFSSQSDKIRPISPTRSSSLHASSKMLDDQQDSGYQILNPFGNSSPHHVVPPFSTDNLMPSDDGMEPMDDRSVTLLNNFFDEGQQQQQQHLNQNTKSTPRVMKKNYFQTTFV